MAIVLGINTTRTQVPSERTVVNEALNDLNISGAFASPLEDTQIGKPTNRGNVQEMKALTYSAGSYSLLPRA